jgi:hypothetical protein
MSLYSFICNIASGLIEVKAKVGRPLGKTPPQCKRAIAVKRPVNDVRTDGDCLFSTQMTEVQNEQL